MAQPLSIGELAPQTRSRKLLEADKSDTMHIWLGFKTQAEMEKALKEGKKFRRPSGVSELGDIDEMLGKFTMDTVPVPRH